jgi:hypothetical protein
MKTKLVPIKIDNEIKEQLEVDDFVIDKSDILECYKKSDIKKIIVILKDLKLPDFEPYLKSIRIYRKLQPVQKIQDATVETVQSKRFEIRNAINTLLYIKDTINDKKSIWKEINYLIQKIYDRTKDGIMILEEVKALKNDGLRVAEVNFRMKELVAQIDILELFMTRFKQIEDEIKETLNYLQDVRDDNSRTQTLIELALDTGELERRYWRKNQE